MPSGVSQPLVEAFLIIEQPRQRFGHWMSTIAPLDSRRAPALAGVTAYYDPTCDQALLGLRYDELALGAERLAFVIEVALLAEIGMVQPGELAEGDRKRFVSERLLRCPIHVTDKRSVSAAFGELVKKIKVAKASPRTAIATPKGRPTVPPGMAASMRPRSTTEDPILLSSPKGTRNDLPQVRSTRDDVEIIRTPGPHVIPRAQMAAEPGAIPNVIYARYLRSGRWIPIRIGALSLKGASLMTGALPRLHDHVDIALSFASHRALVRGVVGKVSTLAEASSTGAATFAVGFTLDDTARRQLTDLLTAARAANVTIKPPPPRATRRFPVEWPVVLGTMRGAIRAEALDVSSDGMFVRPLHALAPDSSASFTIVLDDTSLPISGRARIVRQIDNVEAHQCGLSPGFGLHIYEMAAPDRERWMAFLSRIERRADKRVLIGAAPARLAELQAALAAAGYAVTGGTDPGALVQLASAETRPVDAALIDAAWLAPGASSAWVQSLFSARNVPCLSMHGDSRRARSAVDKLLAVV
jgi:hypothetical protein